jgi:surface polysaccharide O-acyltransferase-like enzyme
MYTLLAIYLLLPIIQTLIKNCDKKKIEYILALWFVFSIAIPLLSRYVPGFKISDHVGLVLCEGYVGYFILGHYLKKYKGDVKPSRGVLMWLGGAVGTGVCAAVELLYSKNTGEVYTGFVYQAYLTPFVVLSCCGLFIFFGNQRFRLKGKVAALITGVSALSVGVYYIHMIVLTFLEEVGFVGESNILVLEAKIIATYLVSLVGAFIISKIPVVRKILLGVN